MKRLRYLAAAWAALVVMVWAVIVLGGGSLFDRHCIEGRISDEQAQALNAGPWGKCPGYSGSDGCEARAGDRILARECSQISRAVFRFGWGL